MNTTIDQSSNNSELDPALGFEALFESPLIGIVQLDKSLSTMRRVNRRFCQMIGFTTNELSGRALLDLVRAEDHESVRRAIEEPINIGEQLEFEAVLVRSDKGTVRLSLTASRVTEDTSLLTAQFVSEQKVMEDTLRRAHQTRIDDLFSNNIPIRPSQIIAWAPLVLYVYDLDIQSSIFQNRPLGELLGYSDAESAALGSSEWRALMHPEDQIRFLAHRECLMNLNFGEQALFEYRMRHQNGEWRWILSRDTLVDTGSNRRLILGSAGDITERRKSEERLQASHDTFRQLVERSPFGVYVIDSDFRLIHVGEGARRVFQNVQPLLGRDFAEVLRIVWKEPFATEAIALFRHTLVTGEPYHAPSTVEVRKDIALVESYDWKIERLVLPDGRYGVVCHFYDLSERNRYEEALRESEKRFRSLSNSAPVMIWVTDADDRCSFLNKTWYDFTGQTENDALGLGWLQAVHPDDVPACQEQSRELRQHRQPVHLDYRLRRRDGLYRWVSETAIPRFSEEDEFLGYVGCVTDVTEQRTSQDALREADKRKDEFLATLAHELRNPLTPIRYALELMNTAPLDAGVQSMARAMMERQIVQFVRLIDDLLDVSRITRDKLELKREPIDLRTPIQNAIEDCAPLVRSFRHTLKVDLPDEPFPVIADHARIVQVFGNLITNAAKYTSPEGQLAITLSKQGSNALVTVTDNGQGIDPEVLPRLLRHVLSSPKRTLEVLRRTWHRPFPRQAPR